MHQATERYLSAVLLVFTNYKPKTHDLGKMLNLCGKLDAVFHSIFPSGTEEERQSFTQLNKAYVSARYDQEYRIQAEAIGIFVGSR